VRLLANRPSSGVFAGLGVLVVAGATVVAAAVGFHGHPGSGGAPSGLAPTARSTPAPPGASSTAGLPQTTQSPSVSPTGASPPATVSASPSTTVPATSFAPAPAATPTPVCAAADLVLTTATDQATYQMGASVRITTTIRNGSARTCTTDGTTGCGPSFEVLDSAGATVWTSNQPGAVVNCPPARQVPLTPGQTMSFSAGWAQCTWSNQKCTGQVQRGAYTAAGVWSEGTAQGARFSIA